ncbi:MAG: Fe-S cluster assembly protein SufD [Alphaproteobacteria bacterium]
MTAIPYQAQFEALKSSFGALAPQREAAFARYAKHGFPAQAREAWRYTKLSPIANADFAPAEPAPLTAADIAAHLIPDAITLVFVNGRFDDALSNLDQAEPGLTVESLQDAIARGDDLGDVLDNADAGPDDALVSLNTAMMADGALIRVADGARIEAPIHLLFFANRPGMAHIRNLISLGASARATLVESYYGSTETYWTNVVNQIDLGDGAHLEHARAQEESKNAYHIGVTKLHLTDDASFNGVSVMRGGILARNEVQVTVSGEGADCKLAGVSLGRDKQVLDSITRFDHAVPNSTSDQLFKSVLDDQSHAIYQGKVIVRQDAQHTDATQANHNLLLARSAQASSKPELEIYADDVKCAHGATVGEMDASMMFYLKSRGLDEETAQKLLIDGFVTEVLERIPSTEIRDVIATDIAGWRLGG